jgi:type VI secretion system secreted protein Hcp
MASEIFLKLSNGVNGESKGQGHKDEIDVLSLSMGLSNPSSVHTGGGAGTGKVDWNPIRIQKNTDLASSALILHCAQGTHFDDATITVREAGGQTPVEFLIIKMTQVFIDQITWGESSGGGKPTENVHISYATIDCTYWSQNAQGGKDKKTEIGWDVKANTATAAA